MTTAVATRHALKATFRASDAPKVALAAFSAPKVAFGAPQQSVREAA
jgi:hypothetical protein